MFCKYCGVTIANDSKFCHNCGRDLFSADSGTVINQRIDTPVAASVNTATNNVSAQPVRNYAQQTGGAAYNNAQQTGGVAYNNVQQTGGVAYNNIPQTGGTAYNNIPQTGGVAYNNVPQTGGVAYNNVPQNGGVYSNIPAGSVVYNTLPGRDMTGINTNAAKRKPRPDIRVYDGFFFRHLDKKNEFLLKVGAAVIALWTAAAVVMIFFPQCTNLL
jgi:hypothetical protein